MERNDFKGRGLFVIPSLRLQLTDKHVTQNKYSFIIIVILLHLLFIYARVMIKQSPLKEKKEKKTERNSKRTAAGVDDK